MMTNIVSLKKIKISSVQWEKQQFCFAFVVPFCVWQFNNVEDVKKTISIFFLFFLKLGVSHNDLTRGPASSKDG